MAAITGWMPLEVVDADLAGDRRADHRDPRDAVLDQATPYCTHGGDGVVDVLADAGEGDVLDVHGRGVAVMCDCGATTAGASAIAPAVTSATPGASNGRIETLTTPPWCFQTRATDMMASA